MIMVAIASGKQFSQNLTLVLLTWICPTFANSVHVYPDQLASEEANWSGSALFVTQYINFINNLDLRNLIGWHLEMGVVSIYSAWQDWTYSLVQRHFISHLT